VRKYESVKENFVPAGLERSGDLPV